MPSISRGHALGWCLNAAVAEPAFSVYETTQG